MKILTSIVLLVIIVAPAVVFAGPSTIPYVTTDPIPVTRTLDDLEMLYWAVSTGNGPVMLQMRLQDKWFMLDPGTTVYPEVIEQRIDKRAILRLHTETGVVYYTLKECLKDYKTVSGLK